MCNFNKESVQLMTAEKARENVQRAKNSLNNELVCFAIKYFNDIINEESNEGESFVIIDTAQLFIPEELRDNPFYESKIAELQENFSDVCKPLLDEFRKAGYKVTLSSRSRCLTISWGS